MSVDTVDRQSERPVRRGLRRRALLGGSLALVLVVAVLAAVLRDRTEDSWTTVWSDDFSGRAGAPPDPGRWIVDTGTGYPGGAPQWGTGEQQVYTDDPANVALDGSGRLVITALRDDAGAWTSGRVETRRSDLAPRAGQTLEVSARMRLPDGGRGYWAAFWMLGEGFRPTYTTWPATGEIDILENIGTEPASAHGTLHCGTNPGGPCQETTGLSGTYTDPDGSALSGGYHTFAVQWDRSTDDEQLRWYVDGHRFFTVHASDVGADTWAEATHHGFFLLLNLAVGGSWPGPPDTATPSGAKLIVDEVRARTR